MPAKAPIGDVYAQKAKDKRSQSELGASVIGWREPGHSLPSGHTSQSFFLATYLLLTPLNEHLFQFGLAGAVGLYTIAAFVGFTHVCVGAHYPRDVIGGALMGSIWGILATFVDPYWLGVRLLGLGSG
jgi:membrane-associated phospholipid phosphatase